MTMVRRTFRLFLQWSILQILACEVESIKCIAAWSRRVCILKQVKRRPAAFVQSRDLAVNKSRRDNDRETARDRLVAQHQQSPAFDAECAVAIEFELVLAVGPSGV